VGNTRVKKSALDDDYFIFSHQKKGILRIFKYLDENRCLVFTGIKSEINKKAWDV
jgi:hypothetical protein